MKILISGAGIAGLSLARALRDVPDCEVTLIEKREDVPLNTAGIALPANAVAALKMLNLGERLEHIAHQVHTIRYTDEQEQVLAEASLLEAPLNLDKFVALSRDDFRNLLLEDLNVPIQYGTTISSIKNNDDGAWVTLSSTSEKTKYDLVVAADGIHSELRVLEGENRDPLIDFGVVNWRWILPCDTSAIQPTYQFGDTDSKLLLTYPISENQVYIYAHFVPTQDMSRDELNNIEFIKSSFSEFGGLAKEIIDGLNSDVKVIVGRLKSVPAANFYNKRVAFVGDAANACSPMLQQGAAAALEDILTLATMVKKYPIDKALELYKSTRKERVEGLISGSDRPLKFMLALNRYLGNWTAKTVRNFLFYLKGPLNVAGWKTLLSTNPLTSLISINAEMQRQEQLTDSVLVQGAPAVVFTPQQQVEAETAVLDPSKKREQQRITLT